MLLIPDRDVRLTQLGQPVLKFSGRFLTKPFTMRFYCGYLVVRRQSVSGWGLDFHYAKIIRKNGPPNDQDFYLSHEYNTQRYQQLWDLSGIEAMAGVVTMLTAALRYNLSQ
ncbi:MAG: hypothetical protein IPM94_12635 [bacterium]|nr:hypothetical protein [bacterium]